MLLKEINQLPNGRRVKIIGVPKDSGWETFPDILEKEGYIDNQNILFNKDEELHTPSGTSRRFYGAQFHGFPLEVIDLDNDPDGNY